MKRVHKSMSKLDTVQVVATEGTIPSVATKWGLGSGTLATTFGWLTTNGAAVLIGIIVTILTFVINYLYQRRRDKRESEQAAFRRELELENERRREELHQAQLKALERGYHIK